MNSIAIPPLTEQQRKIGRLAYIIREDPPEYQAAIYAPLRALEKRVADEAAARTPEPNPLAEMLASRRHDLEVGERSSITSFRPSGSMPKDTLLQRVRAYVADYFAAPF